MRRWTRYETPAPWTAFAYEDDDGRVFLDTLHRGISVTHREVNGNYTQARVEAVMVLKAKGIDPEQVTIVRSEDEEAPR